MGDAYLRLGQNKKAIEYYQKAVEINPDLNYAWENMGKAYQKLGENEKANECFQKYKQIQRKLYPHLYRR